MEETTFKKQVPWYFKWWTVIALLLTVGPFGFPFLWKSQEFNFFWKIFLTVAFTILTIVMIWGTWEAVELMIARFKELGLM